MAKLLVFGLALLLVAAGLGLVGPVAPGAERAQALMAGLSTATVALVLLGRGAPAGPADRFGRPRR